jgi:hypothetical protein
MSAHAALLSPFRLRSLVLKNRVFSAAHAPGYLEGGLPGERYQRYHEEKAKGGLALTMIGGSANVSRDSGSIYGQIFLGDDAIVPHFQAFARRIHAHDCAIMCQVTHMGRRTVWNGGDWLPTIAPSPLRDPAHHAVPREMSLADIRRTVAAFADAAFRCRQGGLDGVEIMGSVHLIGQFLSPITNRRIDAYGGSLDDRMRFLVEVLDAVRTRCGNGFIVGLRYIADETNEDGMDADEGVEIGRRLGQAGLVDFLNVNGAWGGDLPGVAIAIPGMAFPIGPYLALAARVRAAAGVPVLHSARIPDPATANHTIAAGLVDLVGMTRAHMADPHLVRKLMAGEEARIRPCVGAGYCMDRVTTGHDAFCTHNAATGRETRLSHTVAASPVRRKLVVVGGGPAGLEAARVGALRGHAVVLFEASPRLGGQILLAAKAGWRRDMLGIAAWLAAEVTRLGVDIRLNRFADEADVLAEGPDVVIIATGGVPAAALPEDGEKLATSPWELLSGEVAPAARVLVYDEAGGHSALSLADFLAGQGREVALVTRDRQAGSGLGAQNLPVYLRNLYRAGVTLTPDARLMGIARRGNALVASFRNEFSRASFTREADQVVVDQGTLPADALFHALLPRSANAGEIDLDALAAIRPQPAGTGAGPMLFRVGDALACRDIHAAIHDSLRLCSAI